MSGRLTLIIVMISVLAGVAALPAGSAPAAGLGSASILITARIGHNCPPGQIFSTYYQRCLTWNAGPIAAQACPPGTRSVSGRCVRIEPAPDVKPEPKPAPAGASRTAGPCPAGQRWHPVLKRCVPRLLKPRPSCPADQVYSEALKKCVPASATGPAPHRCPAGQRYSGALARCLPLTPAPRTAAPACPRGFRYDRGQGRCVSLPPEAVSRCPAGYYFHHYYHRCLPNQYLSTYGRYCPPGQVRIGGRCRRAPSGGGPVTRRCPTGQRYHFAAGRCVPENYFPADGRRCPAGYYYHHYYRLCLLERYRGSYGVHCPPGHERVNGRCRAVTRRRSPTCPAGYYYHHYYRMCLPDRYRAAYGLYCPPGQYLDRASRRCLVRPPAQTYAPPGQSPVGRGACPPGQFFHFNLRRCVPYSYLR
jgi:hypothetical protein